MDTKNWTEITMEKPDESLLREYDGLIGLTLLQIYKTSKDMGKIRLIDFNRHRKEHMYLLRVALIARDIYGMPIEIEGKWWDILRINWKIRKGFDKVSRAPYWAVNGIWVQDLLDLMRPVARERLGEKFTFGEIYDEYYKGSLD